MQHTSIYKRDPATPAAHAAHVNGARYPCSRCIEGQDSADGWSFAESELDADSGQLSMSFNNSPWQVVFVDLPVGTPLYPILAVTNAGQIKFTLMPDSS